MAVRLDKYLWAVRVFKTRSDAAEACRTNKVLINGYGTKPSHEIRIGEKISVRKGHINYSYEVLQELSSRQSAANIAPYVRDITPQEELDKLNIPRETIFIKRDRGTGRPTKKERRQIDNLMDDFFDYDE